MTLIQHKDDGVRYQQQLTMPGNFDPFIQQYFPSPSTRVLDIGCGEGVLIPFRKWMRAPESNFRNHGDTCLPVLANYVQSGR
jgi:hypothetical protein